MKKNFLPFRDRCVRAPGQPASRPTHCRNPLHEASRLLSGAAQSSSDWAGASNSACQRQNNATKKSVGNVASASLCFDNRDLNRRAFVDEGRFSPLGRDDDKGSEGSKDLFAAKREARVGLFVRPLIECNG